MDSNHRFLSQEKPVYVAEGELRGDRTGHQRNLRGTDSSKPSPSTSEVSCEPDCGVLRTAAGELLSTDDIAGRVIAAKGFDPGDSIFARGDPRTDRLNRKAPASEWRNRKHRRQTREQVEIEKLATLATPMPQDDPPTGLVRRAQARKSYASGLMRSPTGVVIALVEQLSSLAVAE
jgi:hypothetical protein